MVIAKIVMLNHNNMTEDQKDLVAYTAAHECLNAFIDYSEGVVTYDNAIKAMRKYADLWHSRQLNKLNKSSITECLHPFNEVVSGDEGDFCCKCQSYLNSNRL